MSSKRNCVAEGFSTAKPGDYVSLEASEAFALVLLFHRMRFGRAVLWSFLLVPVVAIFCSWLAYRNSTQVAQFALVLAGVVVFDCYPFLYQLAQV
jgi:hypothetical protein